MEGNVSGEVNALSNAGAWFNSFVWSLHESGRVRARIVTRNAVAKKLRSVLDAVE